MEVMSIVPTDKVIKTTENADECDTRMEGGTDSESISQVHDEDNDNDLSALACIFCELVITLRCAEVQQYGKLHSPGSVKRLETQELRQGASQGCQDCDLMTRTLEHFCTIGNEAWIVFLSFDVAPYDAELAQLRIRMRAGHEDDIPTEHLIIFRSTADVPINSRWSTIGKRPLVLRDTSSEHAFQMVSNWLQECSHNHNRCYKDKISCLPKRVLKITKTTVILREHVESSTPAKYACLSHCWGKQGPALQLKSETMDQLQSGVARELLPRTFKDAVEICERLGIYFLWIDAMCIRQDSFEDWESEASVMADIYEGAYLTIAATGSGDSDGGCFSHIRDEFSDVALGTTGLCARRGLPQFPTISTSFDYDTTDWPLLERGWVFQERRLSTRIIHYAKDQIFWECTSALLSSSGDQNWTTDRPFDNKNNIRNAMKYESGGGPKSSWRELIEMYSLLNFTKIRDRLPALGGVVKREMQRRQNDRYVAGMWEKTLLEDLGFSRFACYGNIPGIPSWSWACHGHRVHFRDTMGFGDSVATTDLISLEPSFDGAPHMGGVISASIRLKGPTLSTRAVAYLSARWRVFLDDGDDQLSYFDYVSHGVSTYYDGLSPDAELLLIVMSVSMGKHSGSGEMLVLERLPTGSCLRIGHGRLHYTRKDLNHIDPEKLGKELVGENMKRFLALFEVQEVEIV
ncbi:heterokaryon incompatibility protein-domain-containing protein [Paraphoma chrysanthemicola]|uniref:Heterokaryon incompatibility protein-domain-containing protein n=1 Tax=Paraphoma chrysanthemicola TaxID=798071 RepID=A0A8K0QUF7_9PLEO|nr:heterokaryon incompatibility protein-domain-containing protein [Paraphoma chrysanthemicola]